MKLDGHLDTVRAGYDIIAEQYHLGRLAREAVNVEWLDGLRCLLPQTGRVVDLGCGAGVPISRYFVNRGYQVQGFDISSSMIELAKREVPGAEFSVASMEELEFEPNSIDLVVSFFAIVHVPRERHSQMLNKIFGWLRPGGTALLSLGAEDNPEQRDEDWKGAPMRWSHFDATTNLRLLNEAGFTIPWSEVDGPPQDRHLFAIAYKSR